MVVDKLNTIDGINCILPEGAFYAYPNVEGLIGKKTPMGEVLKNDTMISRWFLESANVATVPGEAFGLSPHFRVSYATRFDLLEEALNNIKKCVEDLT